MQTNRREFLQRGLGSAALFATGSMLPRFLLRSAQAARPQRDRRVLVVVQLTGGNDGLNTVIPFRDDRYHRARPTLRIAPNRALKIDDDLGLHPDMQRLKQVFDSGRLCVLNNVGYPNPDRSHFRSMDIWHSGNVEPEKCRDGWLGRAIDHACASHADRGRADAPGAPPLAVHLDDDALPLALRSRRQPVPSIAGLDAFRLPTDAGMIERAVAQPRTAPTSDDLMFVQRVAISACAIARRIKQVHTAAPGAGYPAYGLAQRLKQIAALIRADFGSRIYYTSLGGFDTHARQVLAHGPLLRELSESLAAFQDELRAHDLEDRVLLMTYSEFGRRVRENGSQGTDHGAAAPMFLYGSACRAGIIGPPPNLSDLLYGDVAHEIDFRSVYATILDDWLEIDSHQVLGDAHPRVDCLKV